VQHYMNINIRYSAALRNVRVEQNIINVIRCLEISTVGIPTDFVKVGEEVSKCRYLHRRFSLCFQTISQIMKQFIQISSHNVLRPYFKDVILSHLKMHVTRLMLNYILLYVVFKEGLVALHSLIIFITFETLQSNENE
jgi:hypothetical protein